MDFDSKFNILYDLITYDLGVTNSLMEELRDIVTTKWADELSNSKGLKPCPSRTAFLQKRLPFCKILVRM